MLGLRFVSDLGALCKQDQLAALQKAIDTTIPFYVYLILRLPRVEFVRGSVQLEGARLRCLLKVADEEAWDILEHTSDLVVALQGSTPDLNQSRTQLRFLTGGESIGACTALELLLEGLVNAKHGINAEVLYIGQSYGQQGERSATSRLIDHSTLQRIYFDTQEENRDKEIWLLPLSFAYGPYGALGDQADGSEADDDTIFRFADTLIAGGVDQRTSVNLVEAALIHYFKPAYNSKYVDRFPDTAHTSYKEVYERKISEMTILLRSDDVGLMLFSPERPPARLHQLTYSF